MESRVVSFIGLGSNLGSPVANCQEALERIKGIRGIRLVRASSFYLTSPVGWKGQGDFINAACEIKTSLKPQELLAAVKEIEKEMGRIPTFRWGPRLIDLDILLYDHLWVNEKDLQIPHPRLHERRFFLVPLCEIAPYAMHPIFGITMKGLLERLGETDEKVELLKGLV